MDFKSIEQIYDKAGLILETTEQKEKVMELLIAYREVIKNMEKQKKQLTKNISLSWDNLAEQAGFFEDPEGAEDKKEFSRIKKENSARKKVFNKFIKSYLNDLIKEEIKAEEKELEETVIEEAEEKGELFPLFYENLKDAELIIANKKHSAIAKQEEGVTE